ncbi:DUF1189 domain-containing protein [Clostridium saccharobutylicum]|uniref:DUF1189 domain-containing protein n=1 Tax=Clostridium saccharobutylicum TaxID=169679 RepID=A0A1S8N3N6_CLOSA|nr:DUF1189 domain-containing protein [Clostridium saccharobutylicum]OOM11074.1 hypothetical protein CLOSAC_26160 [Clostridium saccharobutylicum]
MNIKTNFFKKFITSIYDIKVFSKYAKEGLLRAIIYGVLLSLILGGIKGVASGYRFNSDITQISEQLQSEKYKFFIENGNLNINEAPIKFEQDNTIIYIDNSKNMADESDLKSIVINDDVSILVLRDGIIVSNYINKYKMSYINLFGDKIIDSTILKTAVKNLDIMFVIASSMISMGFTIFNTLLNCLIVVAFASILTIFMRMVVKYNALYSLTLYAATLPLIIQTILQIVNPTVNFDVTFVLGTLTYVILILKYIKAEIIENINKGKL